MAIVGTAFVRLRVIGDKLKNDISQATKDAIQDASPDLNEAGRDAGRDVGDGMGDGVEESTDRDMPRRGQRIAQRISEAMAKALAPLIRTKVGGAFARGFDRISDSLGDLGSRVSPVFEGFGDRWAKASAFKFKGIFGKLLSSAVGLAVLALPSILSFIGVAIGSVVATSITAIAALGPAFAGAGIAGVAAFSAVMISTKLLGLAMKYPSDQLTDFQERAERFRGTIARPIQAGLLSGLNAAMRIAQPVVNALQPQLTRLGMAAGDVAIGFADAMRQGANMERLGRILDTNNQFITDAGGGISKLGQAFVIVLDALRPITTEIGQMIGQLGDFALRSAEAGSASGGLAAGVERYWRAFTYFVGILVDYAKGIGNIFSAASQASGGMLQNLQANADAFNRWTGDPANQERMVGFFERMRTAAGQVFDLLQRIGGASIRGLEGTNIERFTGAIEGLIAMGAPIATMFSQIKEAAGPSLQNALNNFTTMMVHLAESGVLTVVADALSMVFEAISMLLAIPGIGQLLALAAGALAIFKALSLLWTLLGPVVRILILLVQVVGGALVAAFGWIPVIIGLVVAALIWFFTQTEIGRQIIEAVWNAIVAAFNWAKDAIMTALEAVWGFLQETWDVISTVAQAIWGVVSTVFGAIRDFFVTVFTAIWNVVSTYFNIVWTVVSTVMNAIWTVISTILNVIWVIYRTIIMTIVAFVVAYFQLMWGVISTVMQAIWLVISTIWEAIWGFLEPIISAIWEFIVGAWEAISGAISTAMEFVWGVISGVWNRIWGFISGILGAIGGFISSVWSSVADSVGGFVSRIWERVRDGFNTVVDFIRGIPGRVIGLAGDFLSAGGRIISGLMDGIAEGINAAGDFARSVVNRIIDFLNSAFIDGLNDLLEFTIPVPGLPDININPPDIPRIPRLAKGGTISPTTGGTLALIAEAGRSERVEPLDPQGLSRRDRAMIDLLAGSAGAGANVQVYIGTRELTELVDFVVEDREERLADRILTGTKG